MLNENDLLQIKDKGIQIEEIENQINLFKNGIDFVRLERPAIAGDGIEVLSEEMKMSLVDFFDDNKNEYGFIKFVPASGAASRMFKALFEALEGLRKKGISSISSDMEILKFFNEIMEYPFYSDLKDVIKEKGDDLDELLENKNYQSVLEYLLENKGLNYGQLPKGLLKFHRYPEADRTAMEEHYEEAARYLTITSANLNLHFTVSAEHKTMFASLAEKLNKKYKNEQGLVFNTGFSVQHPSTDTIAVDLNNNPFRKDDEALLFRPGGHGALLENLSKLEEGFVFIGNIDNVSPDNNKQLRSEYKKILGGFLMKKIRKIHTILKRIEENERGEALQTHILDIIGEISPETAHKVKEIKGDSFYNLAFNLLNRPVRVCGMVKNVGEPGGGPFWVSNKAGEISKQIIESSQINLEDAGQKEKFMNATHFNPVDLVCYILDYKENRFDLSKFRDRDMAFIAHKSVGSRELKALELPGLWNGAMAGWLTWFVDVPLETFTPVKTVFDLLRPEHR